MVKPIVARRRNYVYPIERVIGKGQFSVVYRAKNKSTDNPVALKKIQKSKMSDDNLLDCMKEIRLLQVGSSFWQPVASFFLAVN